MCPNTTKISHARCQNATINGAREPVQAPSFHQRSEYHRLVQTEISRGKAASNKTYIRPAVKPEVNKGKGIKR